MTRKVVQLADHKITYILVRPPKLPKLPAPPLAQVAEPSAEEQAAAERRAAKPCEDLSLTRRVYLGAHTVTELVWSQGGRSFRAYSNVDFRHLDDFMEIETGDTVFSFNLWLCPVEVASIPAEERPAFLGQIALSETEAEYLFEGSEADAAASEAALRALDVLHAYCQLNQSALAVRFNAREAASAAQELARKENPPKPADVVIRFWPVRSSLNR